MSITDRIRQLRDEYVQTLSLDGYRYINEGECLSFAEDLFADYPDGEILHDTTFLDALVEPENVEEETGMGYDADRYGLFFVNAGLPNCEHYESKPPLDYRKVFSLPCHHWLYLQGKHYDAECPEGVDNFFQLPCFVREMQHYLREGYSLRHLRPFTP